MSESCVLERRTGLAHWKTSVRLYAPLSRSDAETGERSDTDEATGNLAYFREIEPFQAWNISGEPKRTVL